MPILLTLHFDGACEPVNPGGVATYGWLLATTGEPAQCLATGYGVACDGGPLATNNFAEYCALGFGLRWIADHKPALDELTIFGDSKLVIEQLNKRWNCNAEHLIKLRDRCFELLKLIDKPWSAQWIGRDFNSEADALSRRAYIESTGKPFPERKRRHRQKLLN